MLADVLLIDTPPNLRTHTHSVHPGQCTYDLPALRANECTMYQYNCASVVAIGATSYTYDGTIALTVIVGAMLIGCRRSRAVLVNCVYAAGTQS